jgi:hypothetical protein
MAVKQYRLTGKAAPFVRGGSFQFKVRFERTDPGGTRRIVALKRAPVITMPVGGVVQTENEIAQAMLENFRAPTKSRRNGQAHPSGLLFDDVTGTGAPVDVDLDPMFASV